MKFNLNCQLSYSLEDESTFIFSIKAAHNRSQKILQDAVEIDPPVRYEEYIAPDTHNCYLRLHAPAGHLKIAYRATVEVSYIEETPTLIPEVSTDKLPIEILPYLYPSRYCQSDRLIRLAQYEFGEFLPGYSRITAICNWIYDNVAYLYGSTSTHTSAYDTATERAGVCRDFAHLGIAFCRALNVPARFITGYAYGLDPPDFHACFEAYLGDRWYLFDSTRLVPRKGFVRIGAGRDAADVSFATIFGTAQMEEMDVSIDLSKVSTSISHIPTFTDNAIVSSL
ncbi:MAG: transglutaminase family protein [Cyanobacteria bacterium SID2]|nr:transglutaminase family protein [Cyanobacteria bacterium SID2]MBP0004122.1 transglutaminase family protein [Cyanobacteria bacterium SBC]